MSEPGSGIAPGRGPLWPVYAVVFIASACVMVVEIVAGRLISRHVGQSLYTWTSVIGVVLAGLSAGNYGGGRLADRFPARPLLAALLAAAALTCVGIPALNQFMGSRTWLWEMNWPLRILCHVTGTFLLPSLLLGTISPVMARLALSRGGPPGRVIGAVYAWGTAGSIAGTFLAGFYLIAAFGTTATVVGVGVLLGLLAVTFAVRRVPAAVPLALVLAGAWAALAPGEAAASWGRRLLLREPPEDAVLLEEESAYSYIAIKSSAQEPDHRVMVLDRLQHSVTDLRNPRHLHYEYEQIYAEVLKLLAPTGAPVATFMIGGGGYAFPHYLEVTRPGSRIDVAEIDPEVTRVAMAACGLPSNTTVRTFTGDARNVVADLNRAHGGGAYDAVLGDSINHFSVPYHLTTDAFTREAQRLLKPDGVYMLNLIDVLDVGLFLGSIVRTMQEVFPEVRVFACHDSPATRDTFVVVCSPHPLALDSAVESLRAEWKFSGRLLTLAETQDLARRPGTMVLTDDHAPVENLLAEVVRRDPGDVWQWYSEAGVSAAKAGNRDRAEALLRRALEINPRDPSSYYNYGVLLLERQRAADALQAFGAAITLQPDNLEARNQAAMIFAQAGQYDKALMEWNEIVTRKPDHAAAHNNIGNALFAMGDEEQARRAWETSLRCDPRNPRAHANLGTSLREAGDRRGAMEHYRAALAIDPAMDAIRKALAEMEAAGS